MQKSVLSDFPDAALSVTIVWIDMTITDSESAARRAAARITDPRVRQYYDPNRMVAGDFAPLLIKPGKGQAWDVYLFFDKGVNWADSAPRPTQWFHQLGTNKALDPSLYRAGDDLEHELHRVTQAMLRDGGVTPRGRSAAPGERNAVFGERNAHSPDRVRPDGRER